MNVRRFAGAFLVVLTLLSALAIAFGVRISPDVSALLPSDAEGGALASYVRAFGGTDPAVVLVQGEDADEVERGASDVAAHLAQCSTIAGVASALSHPASNGALPDATLAFRIADAKTFERLAEALSPEGMRRRLRDTRALLLAPGASALQEQLRVDPLRLFQLVVESQGEVFAGGKPRSDGAFATDDGKARLVVATARPNPLSGSGARAVAADVENVLATARHDHPGLTFGFTGGHAIAAATERMLRDDLTRSGLLSVVLCAAVFLATFERRRALLAVLPPLLVGTIWTASLAVFVKGGLSGIAIAFAAVVVGVGVDTGVHVYAALLRARRSGMTPREAATAARRNATRPVLVAAFAAALAFSSLGLSGVSAIRQLGLLSAAGEVLTAIAIVLILPEIGALLERANPPPERAAAWIGWVARTIGVESASSQGKRAGWAVAAIALPALVAGLLFPAHLGGAVLAVRPAGLSPIDVQKDVYRLFGGREGQWVVLVRDLDREGALARGDRLVEALGQAPTLVDGFDAVTRWMPSRATQERRLAARDALDLPARARLLEAALSDTGFAAPAFEPALAALRAPSHELSQFAIFPESSSASPENRLTASFFARHVAYDRGETVVALYVRPRPGQERALETLLRSSDPGVGITGYARLEAALRASLLHDFPRIAVVAMALVALSLFFSLRRPGHVFLALLVLGVEIAAVLALARAFGITLHLYDALVLPALFGITIDEAIFLLERARDVGPLGALRGEGAQVASTALTTAAGFASLLVCRFTPLRDLGALGAMGSVAGLVAALVIVPSGLQLLAGVAPRRNGPIPR